MVGREAVVRALQSEVVASDAVIPTSLPCSKTEFTSRGCDKREAFAQLYSILQSFEFEFSIRQHSLSAHSPALQYKIRSYCTSTSTSSALQSAAQVCSQTAQTAVHAAHSVSMCSALRYGMSTRVSTSLEFNPSAAMAPCRHHTGCARSDRGHTGVIDADLSLVHALIGAQVQVRVRVQVQVHSSVYLRRHEQDCALRVHEAPVYTRHRCNTKHWCTTDCVRCVSCVKLMLLVMLGSNVI